MARPRDPLNKEIAEMHKTPHSQPKRAAAPLEPEAPRARKKWSDLHSALSQLVEARTLAVEDQIDGEGSCK
jgi:hypothetical protein